MYTIYGTTFTLFDFGLCVSFFLYYKSFFLVKYSFLYYVFILIFTLIFLYGIYISNISFAVILKSLRLFTYYFCVQKLFNLPNDVFFTIFKYLEFYCIIIIIFTLLQFCGIVFFNIYIPGFLDNTIFPHIRTDISQHANSYSHMFENSFRLRSLLSEPSEIALSLCPYFFILMFNKQCTKFRKSKIALASFTILLSLSFTGVCSLIIIFTFYLFKKLNSYLKLLSISISLIPFYFIYELFGEEFFSRAEQRLVGNFDYFSEIYQYFLGVGVVGKEFIGDWTPSLHRSIIFYGFGGTFFLFVSYVISIKFFNLNKLFYLIYLLILINFTQLSISYWIVYMSIPFLLIANKQLLLVNEN